MYKTNKTGRTDITSLFRPSDVFLPAAFFAASVFGRGAAAFGLFVALYAVKLFSLFPPEGLRTVFAVQPSMRYVQGSATAAMLTQLAGAALAFVAFSMIPEIRPLRTLIPCGLLLNIEHVFYEYLYTLNEKESAMLCRGITAVMTLLGLLLCMPPIQIRVLQTGVDPLWPLLTTGLSSLVAAVIGLSLGGRFHPKLNAEILRRFPVALLQSSLCPALIYASLRLLWPDFFSPAALFAGVMLYESCRTPFRRTARESALMNRILFITATTATICLIVSHRVLSGSFSDVLSTTCCSLLIASLCGFSMYGSTTFPRRTARIPGR